MNRCIILLIKKPRMMKNGLMIWRETYNLHQSFVIFKNMQLICFKSRFQGLQKILRKIIIVNLCALWSWCVSLLYMQRYHIWITLYFTTNHVYGDQLTIYILFANVDHSNVHIHEATPHAICEFNSWLTINSFGVMPLQPLS